MGAAPHTVPMTASVLPSARDPMFVAVWWLIGRCLADERRQMQIVSGPAERTAHNAAPDVVVHREGHPRMGQPIRRDVSEAGTAASHGLRRANRQQR